MRSIAAIVLSATLGGAAATGWAAKSEKPVAVGASISIGSELTSASDPIHSLFRFKGDLHAKRPCRKDRQVVVLLSTDGGPAVPDGRKGGFTEADGDWASVYEVALQKGHTYSALARVNRIGAGSGKQRLTCKAATSAPVTVAP